jgi:hypothetical protein
MRDQRLRHPLASQKLKGFKDINGTPQFDQTLRTNNNRSIIGTNTLTSSTIQDLFSMKNFSLGDVVDNQGKSKMQP